MRSMGLTVGLLLMMAKYEKADEALTRHRGWLYSFNAGKAMIEIALERAQRDGFSRSTKLGVAKNGSCGKVSVF